MELDRYFKKVIRTDRTLEDLLKTFFFNFLFKRRRRKYLSCATALIASREFVPSNG